MREAIVTTSFCGCGELENGFLRRGFGGKALKFSYDFGGSRYDDCEHDHWPIPGSIIDHVIYQLEQRWMTSGVLGQSSAQNLWMYA